MTAVLFPQHFSTSFPVTPCLCENVVDVRRDTTEFCAVLGPTVHVFAPFAPPRDKSSSRE